MWINFQYYICLLCGWCRRLPEPAVVFAMATTHLLAIFSLLLVSAGLSVLESFVFALVTSLMLLLISRFISAYPQLWGWLAKSKR